MQVTEIPIDDIQPHPLNPRRGDIKAIEASIRENGFYGFIVVQPTTSYILKGNHTWKALRRLGWKTVPVHFLDVDDDAAERILLSDNRVSDSGSYDEKRLLAILDIHSKRTGALEGTGYDEEDLMRLHRRFVSPGSAQKKPERPRQVCPNCGHRF